MSSGHSGDSPDAAWRPPVTRPQRVEEVAGFTDLEEVGRGGDSVVYRARQESVGRDVAIKVLDVDDPVRVARFAREIQITVDLGRQHPNIVTVLATGTTESGRPAIVMDFFDGGTLHDRLKAHGPLAVEEVGRIGAVLADALSFAHERGVLHRDVKPQNVLVLPTSWVLTDFGIARLEGSEHTSSAETFTYRHAAPQILDGHPPTAADDVWSLGSTLYTLLDGRPPFASDDPDDDSALAYLRRARTEQHRPLDVPGTDRIAPIIDQCLSKDVAGRPPSAAALRDALLALRTSAWEPGGAPDGEPEGAAFAPGGRPGDLTPTPTPTPTPIAAPAPVLSAAPIAPRQDAVEPAPVALSAVAHAARAQDIAPTGTGLPDDHTGPDPRDGGPAEVDPGPDVDEPARGPRRRKLPLILGGAALAIGLTLGLVGAAVRGGDDDRSATPAPSEQAIPILAEEPTDAPTFRGRPDPKLAPVLQTLKYDGVSLQLNWTDPTNGEALFNLYRVDPDGDALLHSYAAGERSDELATTIIPGSRACYYVVLLKFTGEFGVSKGRCYTYKPR